MTWAGFRLDRVLAVVVAVLLVVSVGACGASGGADEPIRLRFWSWVPGIGKSIEIWNRQNPDIQVTFQRIPGGNNGGYAKMFTAQKAGSPPDLAQVEYHMLPQFVSERALLDLNTLGVSSRRNDFVEWQWRQGVFGDRVYGVPQASGPMAMYYRADLFAKWGIKVPTTWAEYELAARKVRAADPKAYLTTFPPGTGAWFAGLSWQAGARWFGQRGPDWTVGMDDPATRKVARYWDRLRAEKLIKTDQDQQSGWFSDVQRGHLVSWVAAQWGDTILANGAPNTSGKWRLAPMPQWTAGQQVAANWGGTSTAVMAASRHPEAALKFALWLNTDPVSVAENVKGGYGWPAVKRGAAGTALEQPNPFFGGQREADVFAEADRNVDTSWKWSPMTNGVYANLQKGLQAAAIGQGTFESALGPARRDTIADMRAKGFPVSTAGG